PQALQLDAAGRYAMWVACFNARERRALYRQDFADHVAASEPETIVREAYEASDAPTLVERLLDVDTQTFLPDQLLVKMDIASMANSLEVRSPLLDHVFMEMAASLPLSAKLANGTSKRLLKQAIRRWVPSEVVDRPKRGFTMPVADWLRNELRELPASVLLDSRARERGMFSTAAVERLIHDHQRATRDNANKLWA